MRSFFFIFSLAFTALTAYAGKNRAPVIPPAIAGGKITVTGITHMGDGCPAASVSTAITDDVSVFSILYSGLQTELLPGPRLDVGKRCWTTISMNLPPGTQLIIEGAAYNGFISLSDANIYARFRTKYFFENGAAFFGNNYYRPWSFMGGLAKLEQGPKTDNFSWYTDAGGIKHFTQCGGPTQLNIINAVELTAAQASSGSAVFDTMDAEFVQRYNAKLVPCTYKFKPFLDRSMVTTASERISGELWRER